MAPQAPTKQATGRHNGVLSGIDRCTHKHYRMSCEDFEHLLERAAHRCEICQRTGVETSHGKLFLDHDPREGNSAVRGLLCASCNTKLMTENGFSPEAVAYLAHPWYKNRPVVDPDIASKALQKAIASKAKLDQLKEEHRALKKEMRQTRLVLGGDIADARRLKVSQRVLAEELGEQRETLRRWENDYKENLRVTS